MEAFRKECKDPLHKPKKLPGERFTRIPMPLCPGETPDDYDAMFERWLGMRGEPIHSLRLDAERERMFRCLFARYRLKETTPNTQSASESRAPEAHASSSAVSSKGPSAHLTTAQLPAMKNEQPHQEGQEPALVRPNVVGMEARLWAGAFAPAGDAQEDSEACCCCSSCALRLTEFTTRMRQLEGIVMSLHLQLAEATGASPWLPDAIETPTEDPHQYVPEIKTEPLQYDAQSKIPLLGAMISTADEMSKQDSEEGCAPAPTATYVPAVASTLTSTATSTSTSTAASTSAPAPAPAPAATSPSSPASVSATSPSKDESEWNRLLGVYNVQNDLIQCHTRKETAEKADAELDDQIIQAKSKRDEAVVELLLYIWSERKEDLALLLESMPSSDVPSIQQTLHEKSSAVADELRINTTELDALRDKWDVYGCRTPDENLSRLSTKIAAAEALRRRLEVQRRMVYVNLLGCNKCVRARVQEAMGIGPEPATTQP